MKISKKIDYNRIVKIANFICPVALIILCILIGYFQYKAHIRENDTIRILEDAVKEDKIHGLQLDVKNYTRTETYNNNCEE